MADPFTDYFTHTPTLPGPVPLPNPFYGGSHGPGAKLNDIAVKDGKVHVSKLVSKYIDWNRAIARQIIVAESSGNPDADNGVCCVGLGQVNAPVWMGKLGLGEPTELGKFKDWLKDPQNNVDAMHVIYVKAGHKWTPWDTFTNGAYRKSGGQDPMVTIKKGTAVGTVTGAAASVADAALGPVDEFIGSLLSPSTWFRVGKGSLGGVFVILGTGALVFIVANRASGGKLGQAAMTAATTVK